MFSETMTYWQKRKKSYGDRSVGSIAEDRDRQGVAIQAELTKLLDDTFYMHGLDFGCGYGRLTPYFAARCGHLWVADIFDDWTERAALSCATTPVTLDNYVLPFERDTFDFVADVMTVQSINEKDRVTVLRELARVTAPGATIVSLMKIDQISKKLAVAKTLKLSGVKQLTVDCIDKKREQYCLLAGTRL